MTTNRCPRCGGTNVDADLYCWSCEYQQPGPLAKADGAAAPPGARSSSPGAAAPAVSGSKRLLGVTFAPIATIVLIGCGFLGVLAFDKADALVGAGPTPAPVPDVGDGSSPGRGSVACVVGRWNLTASEETTRLEDGRTVRGTGAGGSIIFGADGTGRYEAAGHVLTAIVGGQTVTFAESGTMTFRYRVSGGRMFMDGQAGGLTVAASVRGSELFRDTSVVTAAAERYDLGCGGDVLTLRTRTETSDAPAAGGGNIDESEATYTRAPT